MASSNRCSKCGVNWPSGGLKAGEIIYVFNRCPECGEHTWPTKSAPSIPDAEALTAAKRAAFRLYYNGREAEREKRGDPSPEELDHREMEALRRSLAS